MHTAEQGGGAVTQGLWYTAGARRQVWGGANRKKLSLQGNGFQAIGIWGEKAMVDIFCTYRQHLDQRGL